MKNNYKKIIFIFTKLFISISILIFVLRKVDFHETIELYNKISFSVCGLLIALLLLQVVISAERLRTVLQHMKYQIDHLTIIRITFVGYFFSQTLISFIGGDGTRVWQLAQKNISVKDATHAVILDRTSGLVMQLFLITLALPFLLPLANDITKQFGIILLTTAGFSGLLCLFFFRYVPDKYSKFKIMGIGKDLSVNAYEVFVDKGIRRWVFGYSLLINLINVTFIYLAVNALGGSLLYWQSLVIIPTVLFLSMLPISFAGWGVREGAMVTALGLVNIPANISLASSILFGIFLLLISLPGSMLWTTKGKKYIQI